MSIKTLRKRIALVAVSALGVGFLSVAPASAAVTGLTIAAVGTDGTSGYCVAGTPTASTTPRYSVVGGYQSFDVAGTPTADATLSITGPAVFTSVESNAHSISGADRKTITLAATADKYVTMQFTGAGQVVVTADDTTDFSLYFIVAASCSDSYSASASKAQLRDDTGAADSNVDEAAGAKVAYSTTGLQVSYLAIDLNTAYTTAVDTTLLPLIATVTGGCTASFTAAATSGTATIVATGSGNDTNNVVILNDNTPRSCSITMTLGGTQVASKTVNFYGDAASIVVSTADSSSYFAYGEAGSASATAKNANSIVYMVKDSAGNVINHSAAPTLTSTTGGFVQASVADGTYGYADAVTNGYATLDFNASSVTIAGAGKYALKVTRQSDGQSVTSNVIDANITKTVYTFEASWDKASYQIGDIMTLTITGKDSGGRLTHDGEDLEDIEVAVSGATALTTATEADKFLNGVKKYKFAAGTTAATYGWSVNMTSGSGMGAVVGNYTITNPSTGVSNAEVLAAIVKLIASINKQIRALQKSLKR